MSEQPWRERFRRRYLPHLEVSGGCYFITFRLAGSLPRNLRDRADVVRQFGGEDGVAELVDAREEFCEYDRQLDAAAIGPRHLADPRTARMTVDSLTFYDKIRYNLFAYCLMSNHVHVVLQPIDRSDGCVPFKLETIMHSLKSYTSHEANKLLGLSGSFWQREYYDRLLRDEDELGWYMEYTLCNPVAAGLCNRPQDWPWSNALGVYGD